MMDDYRWGAVGAKYILQKQDTGHTIDQSWEWFVDALESDRLRFTLTQFPVTDMLEPESGNAVIDTTARADVQSDSESESDVDDDGSETSKPTMNQQKKSAYSSGNGVSDLWRGKGADLRYSPGFILPLMLGTLEAYLPTETGIEERNNSNGEEVGTDEEFSEEIEEYKAQCQAYCNMCRKLCDKGGISLAVASLSSRCPLVRKVAIAICGLFLKALQMQEAHGMKAWRERPQLEMLMSSLQRGLVVRRAMQLQKVKDVPEGLTFGDDTPQRHMVPMFPATSAVFLAKALMILCRPGDEMYGQMNRYFLRLNGYHGAFQDCFGLPAFLSMYCSASDDLTRCKTERTWALLLLMDGAVDEFCYRKIAQHHVPELIMTSFDSVIDNPDGKSEMSLTIDVIQKLIESGGKRASTHMILRLGLLSWIHGVISWRKISSVFPYTALKCKFLKLIATAVESYNQITCSDDDDSDRETPPFFEKVPLANAVIQICLDGGDGTSDNEAGNESSPELLKSTCDALWAIHLGDAESNTAASIGCGDTSLEEMSLLLTKFVLNDEMFEQVLTSLCTLPFVSNGNDIQSAKLFCELALGFVLEKVMQLSPAQIKVSLERVYELLRMYPQLGEEDDVSSQVMKSRSLAVLVEGGIEVWDRILPFILKE